MKLKEQLVNIADNAAMEFKKKKELELVAESNRIKELAIEIYDSVVEKCINDAKQSFKTAIILIYKRSSEPDNIYAKAIVEVVRLLIEQGIKCLKTYFIDNEGYYNIKLDLDWR